MASLFKPSGTTFTLPDGSHRTLDGHRVTRDTPDAVRHKHKSKTWYGRYRDADGIVQTVKLCRDKEASKSMLHKLATDAKMAELGLVQKYQDHHKRPLAGHLDDFTAALGAKGTSEKQVAQVVSRARLVLDGCGFIYIKDLSPSTVQRFLADLQAKGAAPVRVDKPEYTLDEAAELLGAKKSTIAAQVRRHRLDAAGQGKARRLPRGTVEALRGVVRRGMGNQTANFYLQAVKQFCAWLVADRRTPDSPLAHLAGKNVKLDRRHDRRALTEGELRLLLETAAASPVEFRGLSGKDRQLLYLVGAVTGFRKSELACLRPTAFDLDSADPTAFLAAENAKNGRTAVQPLPPDVVDAMRNYLKGKPTDQPIWAGSWVERAAEMLRLDLNAASIPYAVEGPEGLLYADFHSLRHAYVALLDKTGASLKQAMQLARHTDPKLTMARYGRAQLHDLGEAVRRLPRLLDREPAKSEVLQATGTEGHALRLARALHSPVMLDGVSVKADENSDRHSAMPATRGKPHENLGLRAHESRRDDVIELRPAGFEPATLGLGNRCSIP